MSAAHVLLGDCIESMRMLPDGYFNACITSPPYYGLRDYGVAGQYGLEESPDAYVAQMLAVFREVHRVLRDDGTLWLNLGDSYSGSASTGGSGKETAYTGARLSSAKAGRPKNLLGIPWRVAFALQADGWYLRQEIIWAKPNPMPESVTDRFTKSHEHIFLLSKSEKYYFDYQAVEEPATSGYKSSDFKPREKKERLTGGASHSASMNGRTDDLIMRRRRRDVWMVPTRPYNEAHFAVFPPALVEPCVLAGCPVGGMVLDPFGGSGTTGGVAVEHGRNAMLCELNPAFAALIPERVRSISE